MNFAAYIQATKDDFCLYEVCKRLLDDGLTTFFFCVPQHYWNGRKTPEDEVRQVYDVSEKLKESGASCHVRMFNVDQHRAPGRSLVDVETRVRNDSIAWIRSQGFQHIIIVDGDELWRSTCFTRAKKFIMDIKPQSLALGMVPTIGLPGYPIEGATDMATAYIGPTAHFVECRRPSGETLQLNQVRGIIHFTATRRTMQEIIDKHRASGHYDDPAYDFEGWIANTLPNAKPGLRNAHMYRPYQIWELVRDWTPDELNDIPLSIHPYLGIPKGYTNPSHGH
jgi:hypothetical protein